MKLACLLICASVWSACSSRGVSDPSPIPVWGLSGQSNAVGLKPPLTAFATITGAQQNSQPIQAWDSGQPLWTALETSLRSQPISAFIWWQGEANTDDVAGYPARLDNLLARVRAITGSVPVILCGVNAAPGFDPFRTMQQQYAASHTGIIYAPSNDLPRPVGGDWDVPTQQILPPGITDSPHLTEEGYRLMAARIAARLK